jgi:phage terminase large subunit
VREGNKRAALDIADRGIDLNAYAVVEGRLVVFCEQWSGKGSDTGYSVQRAMRLCEAHGLTSFDYDADGLGGAAVHSDARLINEARGEKQASLKSPTPDEFFQHGQIQARPYRGSEAVLYPERIVPGTKRKAKDLFLNRKAQTWYNGRLGAFHAWKARRGERYEPSLVAGIARDCPLADLLRVQLSQASTKETLSGKIQIDKNPDDEASPDLADAALMALAPRKSSLDNVGARLTMIRAAM